MRKWLASSLAGACAAAVLTAVVGGCATNPSRVFIKGVQAPPENTSAGGGGCTYEPSPTGPFLSGGTLDVAFQTSYVAPLLVGNQMIPRADLTQGRVETSRVLLQGTVVRLTDANQNPITSFTNYGSGVADPATGGVPGYGIIFSTLIDDATALAFRNSLQPRESKRLLAFVYVFGQTTGSQSVETVEYLYPVTVCLGCLVYFPPDSVDPVRSQVEGGRLNCSKAPSSTTNTSTGCLYGQDQPIDCRTCQGNPICDPNYPDVLPAPTTDGGT